MRLLYVVQRYGPDVAGGAEVACRELACRLTARGHDVSVLTTCALDYLTWDNVHAPGETVIDGVRVERLSVARPRDPHLFPAIDGRVARSGRRTPPHLQREWMRMQGPYVPEIAGRLRETVGAFDIVVFYTYLYYTTWRGLHAVGGLAPTLLHPAVHHEPTLRLPLFDEMFRLTDGFSFQTEEEAVLVRSRFGVRRPQAIVGLGVDLDVTADPGLFRGRYLDGDTPYLLYVGRIDSSKATDELFDYFVEYKRRRRGPLKLVFVGALVDPPHPHPDVVVTGFVDDSVKQSAMAGTLALVQPSYFESYSLVLSETWALGRPALVQGYCDVLDGQARRSGGAIPYRGFPEFEAAVDTVVNDAGVAKALGRAGRAYVEDNYAWGAVLDRYERLVDLVASRRVEPTRA